MTIKNFSRQLATGGFFGSSEHHAYSSSPMSSHRKFSCSGFFSAFLSNETELIELLAEFGFSAPGPFTTEEACNDLIMSKPGQNAPLTTELYKLSDLATKKGAEIIKSVIEQFNIPTSLEERSIQLFRSQRIQCFSQDLQCPAWRWPWRS
jgi:hypothetical protein